MIEALRRLDRKFLIFIGCLILIPVLLIVFLIMAQGCSNKKIDYSKYEFQMKTAAKKYLNKVDNMPSEKGDYVIVELDTALAIPKSVTFATPSSVIIILCGFISLWIILFLCAVSNADAI